MGLDLRLRGAVQGIGFRPWVRRLASDLEVRGQVANTPDGVAIEAFGAPDALAVFQARLEKPPLAGACVASIEVAPCLREPEPARFEIASSSAPGLDPARGDSRQVALAPDLPTCPACLAELADPRARRYRYPFIACAHCGPRHTIARALPWDRERTAMHDFPLCEACHAEYASPEDRRHHAEAISCPRCGPTLRLVVPTGPTLVPGPRSAPGAAGAQTGAVDHALEGALREVVVREAMGDERGRDATARAARILRSGGIIGVQGIGGFHLACLACDERAVARLRARKRRPSRPLAVLVASVAEAEKLAVSSASERALLCGEARPIVLLRRRPDSGLAASIAPGFTRVGLLLAYAPVHALLLAEVGEPLVMTSANRSGEPMVHRPRQAAAELAGIADALLVHDREIVAPCDDSVVIDAPSGPIVMRRARGFVPRPIRLARPVPRPVLAFGGQWSNTLCVAAGEYAWLSEHVGDLESPASVERLEQTAHRWLDRLGVEPVVVAHDLHPGYESTLLAKRWPARTTCAVQHHHAHLAAVLGEHGAPGPALGLIWDGTGAGPDGTAWGGELLFGDARGFERVATFRPILLAGGERAIREPWRIARAWLRDAYEGAPPAAALDARFDFVAASEREAVDALLDRPALCVPAHGVGRVFDAAAALLLRRPVATYSGELAQTLGDLATHAAAEPYPFRIDTTRAPWEVDLRPTARALVRDLQEHRAPVEQLSNRFHATLAAAGEAVVREALRIHPAVAHHVANERPSVVLGGGCFQNPVLVTWLEQRLGRDHDVLRARAVPPGDGGLAFGQACVAAAQPAPATEANAASEPRAPVDTRRRDRSNMRSMRSMKREES